MSNRKHFVLAAALALLAQSAAFAQSAQFTFPAQSRGRAAAASKQQVFVRAVVYTVPDRARRRVARLYPELLGRAGSRRVLRPTGFAGTDRFAELLRRAERRGLVRVVSRPSGSVLEGETLSIGTGLVLVPKAARTAGGVAVGAAATPVEVARSIRVSPAVIADRAGPGPLLKTDIDFRMDSLSDHVDPASGLPEVNRLSLSTRVNSRDGETVVLGGLRDRRPRGRLYLAFRGQIVDVSLALAGRK